MPRTVPERICINIYEAAKLNLAHSPYPANIIAVGITTRSMKLNNIASRLQSKENFMSK